MKTVSQWYWGHTVQMSEPEVMVVCGNARDYAGLYSFECRRYQCVVSQVLCNYSSLHASAVKGERIASGDHRFCLYPQRRFRDVIEFVCLAVDFRQYRLLKIFTGSHVPP